MIIYGDIERKQNEIRQQAENLRTAAALIRRLKPVIKAFDNKVYNCKFDNAIGALSDAEHRFYCHNSNGWLYITYIYNHSYSTQVTLLQAASCKESQAGGVFNGKRIDADKMIGLLNQKYESLLQEAFSLETAADGLSESLRQIKTTYDLLNKMIGALPGKVKDICGLKQF